MPMVLTESARRPHQSTQEMRSRDAQQSAAEGVSLLCLPANASRAQIRAALDVVNRKRRAIRKQIADRTAALQALDAQAAELERMSRETP